MPEMVNTSATMGDSVTKSPLKPKLVVEALLKGKHQLKIDLHDFEPITVEDLKIAHTYEYINAMQKGIKPLCESNSVPWSQEQADSVMYTCGSLYNAIKHATENPNSLSLSPTSGFHHAMPDTGLGFCTYSGQVISSVKVWRDTKKVGAYIDLDGHFGNSIGDSEIFCPESIKAIHSNINPYGVNETYVEDFKRKLYALETAIIYKEINYLVFCHGADSHSEDDFVHNDKVDTEHWLECSKIFFEFVNKLRGMGCNVPVVMSLFGGYRADNYQFVIDLHRQDIEMGIELLSKDFGTQWNDCADKAGAKRGTIDDMLDI